MRQSHEPTPGQTPLIMDEAAKAVQRKAYLLGRGGAAPALAQTPTYMISRHELGHDSRVLVIEGTYTDRQSESHEFRWGPRCAARAGPAGDEAVA